MDIDTAIILAGGLGTRLRPLTNETPKPLLSMKGRPIMQHAIENLKSHGVKNIILSIGYKSEIIKDYFRDGQKLGVNLSYSVETEPLGTGGAVKQAANGLNKPFFLVWGDNLMDFNCTELYFKYLEHKKPVTMVLTKRDDVEHFGVAKLQGDKILSFVEKPKREEAPSNLINAGAIILDPKILHLLPEGKSSIERDLYEKLPPGELVAYQHQGQWYPTDTLEKYTHACLNFKPKINLKEKKWIIADVDDTICESCQEISIEMANKINHLLQNGYNFAFISGTKVEDLKKMVSLKLQTEHHLLGTTGTNYTKSNGEEIYNYNLKAEEKEEILKTVEELINYYNIVPLTSKEDQLQDRKSQITFSAIGRNAPLEKKKNYDPEGKKRNEWVNFLTKKLSNKKYDFKIGGTTSIDITRKGLDKEWGIKTFAEHKKINLNEIIFFGDKIYPGGNDYSASRIVDSVAVKNHQDTLNHLNRLFP